MSGEHAGQDILVLDENITHQTQFCVAGLQYFAFGCGDWSLGKGFRKTTLH